MNTITNQTWTRRGVSLLWSAAALAGISRPVDVVPMRRFFTMADRWPENLPASNGDALVVAGLEGCLDILSRSDARLWMEEDLKSRILSFQDEYEGEAALIFWMAGGRRRIRHDIATQRYDWKRAAPDGDKHLEIGQSLWAGAENEVCRIIVGDDPSPDLDGPAWAGLYHPRIS